MNSINTNLGALVAQKNMQTQKILDGFTFEFLLKESLDFLEKNN